MHIHILGICGTFMGGIAVLAKQAGHRVTACEAACEDMAKRRGLDKAYLERWLAPNLG